MASVPTQMKAVQISKTGGIDVLDHTSVQVPSLGEGQILVKNEFAGINFIDTYFRTGLYKAPQFPLILGREGAGQVVSAHDSVANNASLKAGTKVVYMCGPDAGSYSEYTAVNARMAIPIPDGISTKTAAAALLQGLTAWTMIRESANVQAGQWTLVHAAAGGVGLLLCQMLKAVGAKVVGTASTDEKCALAKKNGAEWTVKSGDDLVSKAKEITGEHGFDAIFDGVGKTTFQADLEMIAMKGHLISFGNASGAVDPVNILQLGPKNVSLLRPVLFGYIQEREDYERYTAELFDMIKSGKVNIAVHDVYLLNDVGRAHTDIESRKTTGKLLVQCD